MSEVQPSQEICQVSRGTGRHHPDGNRSSDQSFQRVHDIASAVHGGQGRAGVRQHSAPRLGGTYRPSASIEQFLPQLPFEAFDLRTHTRLSDMETLGRAGEIRFVHHCDEVLELPKFHNG